MYKPMFDYTESTKLLSNPRSAIANNSSSSSNLNSSSTSNINTSTVVNSRSKHYKRRIIVKFRDGSESAIDYVFDQPMNESQKLPSKKEMINQLNREGLANIYDIVI